MMKKKYIAEISLNNGGKVLISEWVVGIGRIAIFENILITEDQKLFFKKKSFSKDNNLYLSYIEKENFVMINKKDPQTNYYSFMPVVAIYPDGSLWISPRINANLVNEKEVIIDADGYSKDRLLSPYESFWWNKNQEETENIKFVKYILQNPNSGEVTFFARKLYKTYKKINYEELKKYLKDGK